MKNATYLLIAYIVLLTSCHINVGGMKTVNVSNIKSKDASKLSVRNKQTYLHPESLDKISDKNYKEAAIPSNSVIQMGFILNHTSWRTRPGSSLRLIHFKYTIDSTKSTSGSFVKQAPHLSPTDSGVSSHRKTSYVRSRPGRKLLLAFMLYTISAALLAVTLSPVITAIGFIAALVGAFFLINGIIDGVKKIKYNWKNYSPDKRRLYRIIATVGIILFILPLIVFLIFMLTPASVEQSSGSTSNGGWI